MPHNLPTCKACQAPRFSPCTNPLGVELAEPHAIRREPAPRRGQHAVDEQLRNNQLRQSWGEWR